MFGGREPNTIIRSKVQATLSRIVSNEVALDGVTCIFYCVCLAILATRFQDDPISTALSRT